MMTKFKHGNCYSSEVFSIFIGQGITVKEFVELSSEENTEMMVENYLCNSPSLEDWRGNVDPDEYNAVRRILIEHIECNINPPPENEDEFDDDEDYEKEERNDYKWYDNFM